MPRVVFTPQLRRFVEAPEMQTSALTVRTSLDEVFELHPRLRAYVLDDQGHLRANVVIFVDGGRLRDLRGLSDGLEPASTVHVFQALSGG